MQETRQKYEYHLYPEAWTLDNKEEVWDVDAFANWVIEELGEHALDEWMMHALGDILYKFNFSDADTLAEFKQKAFEAYREHR
jgi:hypothetical protein